MAIIAIPSSSNLMVGRGEAKFNRFDANGAKTQIRSLGECSKLFTKVNPSTIELYSHLTGASALYDATSAKTTIEGGITTKEFHPENLAIAELGATAAWTQSSASRTDAAIAGTVIKGTGLWTGDRKITVTNVKKGATTLVLNTDYTVDADAGIIMILPGTSTLSDGDSITWSGSCAAIASTKIATAGTGQILGELTYTPATDQKGPRWLTVIPRLQFFPNGQTDLIGDDYGEITLDFKILNDSANNPTAPYGWKYLL